MSDQEPRTGGGERKTPVLLRMTPLGKRVVAITNYTTRSNGVIRAKDGGKHDVTNDFLDLARELGMDITPALDALGLQEVTNA